LFSDGRDSKIFSSMMKLFVFVIIIARGLIADILCISHGSPEKQTNRIEIRDIGDR
jgi:hypothetical protein